MSCLATVQEVDLAGCGADVERVVDSWQQIVVRATTGVFTKIEVDQV